MNTTWIAVAVLVVAVILIFKFVVKPILKVVGVLALVLIAWLLLMN